MEDKEIKTFEELVEALNKLLTEYNPFYKQGVCEYTNCLNLPTQQAPKGEHDFGWKIAKDKTNYYFFIEWGWEDEEDNYYEDKIMLAISTNPQKIYNVIKDLKECEDERRK